MLAWVVKWRNVSILRIYSKIYNMQKYSIQLFLSVALGAAFSVYMFEVGHTRTLLTGLANFALPTIAAFVVLIIYSKLAAKAKAQKEAKLESERKAVEAKREAAEKAQKEAEEEEVRRVAEAERLEAERQETKKRNLRDLVHRSSGSLFNYLTGFVAELEDPSEILSFRAKSSFAPTGNNHGGNKVIAVWSRGVSTLSPKDKLALVLAELLQSTGHFYQHQYDSLRAGIIYNNGNCGIEVRDSFLHESFMGFIRRNSLLIGPDEAFSLAFNAYGRHFPQGVPLIDHLIKKGTNWFGSGEIISSKIFNDNFNPFNLFLGTLKSSNEAVFFDSDESLVTIAPPGCGKTQCHVLPNLVSYCGPIIALDVKGECYEASHDVREYLGPVHRFSPLDIGNSAHYNPIDFVTDDPLKVWEEAQKLTKLIIVTDKSDHWDKRASELLTAIISHVKLNCEIKTMTEVCDWAYADMDEINKLVAFLATSPVNGMRRTGKAMLGTMKASPKMLESNLETLRGYLEAWQGDNITAITSKSDWSPSDFMSGKNSPSLFLVIPPTEIATYASVLRVMIGQHLEYFLRDHANPAVWPILFMLDEMPQLGEMEQITKAQAAGRSYNIKLWMFAQYAGQLQKAYGKEIADGMISSTGVRLYMNPSDETAKNLSEMLGETEDVITGIKEPLASSTDLMGREFTDDVIGRGKGEPPMRLNKVFYGSLDRDVLVRSTLTWALENVTLDDEALPSESVTEEAETEQEEASSLNFM